ncbi:MAG: LemA protein [Blastocatellia bacterium]|jgi:LemA protein|nr:LemA protein [Blastocatellia bacterium]
MNKRRMLGLAFLIFVSVAASGCGYNTLQTKQQNVKAKWSGVENQLQRRADLIPNLVESAKLAGVQEQEVFGQIAQARSQLLNAKNAQPAGENGDKTPEQKEAVIAANNTFGGTIGRLLSLQENYPVLHSNENFLKLQDELTGTENRIAVSRNDYNEAVQDYNTTRGNFPTVIGAKIYGFKEEPYFKAEEGSRQAPRIDANTLRKDQGTK